MALGDEKFTGVNSINDYLFISNIENNLKSFLDWGFLNIGGFINVGENSNTYNSIPNKLAVVQDPNYSEGQIWQTQHSDWVWESIDYNGSSPIIADKVEAEGIAETFTVTVAGGSYVINGIPAPELDLQAGFRYRFDVSNASNIGHSFAFSETSDGTHNAGTPYVVDVASSGIPDGQPGAYIDIVIPNFSILYYYDNNISGMGNQINIWGYVLDFVNSRVVFERPINTSTDLRMNYAYRSVQVHKASSNLVWWKQFQLDIANDITQFNQNTGEYSLFNQNRIQLPSVIIETVPRGVSRPYRLGDKSLVSDQDIILHIVANNPAHRNSILDIIRLQEDKVIWLYDTNKIIAENRLPYNFDGSLSSNRLPYDLILDNEDYRWKTCHLKNFVVSEVESRYYFEEAKIRITAEIIFDDM